MASARSYRDKVGSLARVRRAVRAAQRKGQRVVFTNGCFDLLHPGHVRYLAAARRAGDVLVVGVNSDRSVRGLKGPGRPVQTEDARAEVLAALQAVDHVVVFDAPTPLGLIAALQPDVLAKGADWAADQIVGADVVRARGGKVVRVRIVPGQSTTRLVARSRDAAGATERKQPGRRS
ncbi:D-glycero-beta-D-manno-heptose 1-phosphate adenylyltransferase [Candidatus Binatia bacterium]|nr:D-glycero-beta-D-manno-heptose 1-phosphate adenylyltransferase [Candidatus Binatia bacterium]